MTEWRIDVIWPISLQQILLGFLKHNNSLITQFTEASVYVFNISVYAHIQI